MSCIQTHSFRLNGTYPGGKLVLRPASDADIPLYANGTATLARRCGRTTARNPAPKKRFFRPDAVIQQTVIFSGRCGSVGSRKKAP